jgi:hypothetical protein
MGESGLLNDSTQRRFPKKKSSAGCKEPADIDVTALPLIEMLVMLK